MRPMFVNFVLKSNSTIHMKSQTDMIYYVAHASSQGFRVRFTLCLFILSSSVSIAEWPPFAHSVDHMLSLYFDYL